MHFGMPVCHSGSFSKKCISFQLRDARIAAACTQFGIELPAFREGLARSDIMLNR